MPSRADSLLPHVCRLASASCLHLDDAALLGRFLRDQDPPAFAALVSRHGPMVLRVCQRVLGNRHDAEDALQATFLVLARKAGSVRPGAVAAWLHAVAGRVALQARRRGVRRRSRETSAPDLAPPDPHPDPLADLSAREVLRTLDEEVQRLAETYRLPVILCCLEGLSQEEAARQLGCSPGAIKGRLERGRKRLHERLARRGLELAAVLGLVEVSCGTAAHLTEALADSTTKAALAFAAGKTVPVGGGTEVLALAKQGLRNMALVKARLAISVALLLGVAAAAAGVLAHSASLPQPSALKPDAQARSSAPPASASERAPRTDSFGDPLPPGAVARVGTVRWWCGATDARSRFHGLAYTPDGKSLITCDADNVLRFLDARTGTETRRIELAGAGAALFALAPDGKTMVTADTRNGQLRLWEISTGKELRQLRGDDSGTTQSLAFRPDGKRFAAAIGNRIRLWDTATWEEVRPLKCDHEDGNFFLAFLPDGKTLIAGNGLAVRWWDLDTGRLVRRRDTGFAHGPGIYELAVSPGGQRLAIMHQKDGLYLWDARSGDKVRTITLDRSLGGWCLCFSPDGRTLACSNGVGRRGNQTLFLDAETGRELRRWDEADRLTTRMAFSPDGKVLAQANAGIIRRHDAATGRPIEPRSGLPNAVTALRFSADGHALAAGCLGGRTGSWDPLTGKPLASLQDPPPGFVHLLDLYPGIALAPDSRKAALADARGVVYVWETATGTLCCRIADPLPCLGDGAVFSPDGKILALSHTDSSLRLWETATGRLVRSFPQVKPRFLRPVGFSPDGRLLALYFLSTTAITEANEVCLLDTTTGKIRDRLPWPEDTNPAHVLFTADSKRLIISYDPQWAEGQATHRIGICEWDLATGREVRRYRGPAGPIALSPDERTLATADYRTIHVWERASGQERIRFAGHRQRIRALAFSPDGRLLASGGQDYTALIWDVTGRCPEGKWSSRDVSPGDLERFWAELGEADGAQAWRAAWALAAAPTSVSFLAERLKPVPRVEVERIPRLIADLDSDQFKVRERASQELGRLGDLAEPALRKALADSRSPEGRGRLKTLLDQLPSRPLASGRLREVRAVEVLEQIGTPAARQLLERLATGSPGARLTREARASLDRMARRHPF